MNVGSGSMVTGTILFYKKDLNEAQVEPQWTSHKTANLLFLSHLFVYNKIIMCIPLF